MCGDVFVNVYRICYWFNGDKLLYEVEANSVEEAKYIFYMETSNDDIISVSIVGAANVV